MVFRLTALEALEVQSISRHEVVLAKIDRDAIFACAGTADRRYRRVRLLGVDRRMPNFLYLGHRCKQLQRCQCSQCDYLRVVGEARAISVLATGALLLIAKRSWDGWRGRSPGRSRTASVNFEVHIPVLFEKIGARPAFPVPHIR